MSFLQLPTELKRNIVELVYQQDRNYSSRIGNLTPTIEGSLSSPATPKGVSQRWGKSSQSLSLASKELRALSLPFVLCTLHTSRIESSVFKYHILPMQASSPITHLAFDDQPSGRFLTHLFLFVCPALPNLRKITNFRQEHVSTMFGFAGLRLDFHDEDDEERERRAGLRDAFIRLANRIDIWDVCIDAWDLDCIVLANPKGIKSLTVRYYPLKSWRGEYQAGVLDALIPCASLSELALIEVAFEMTEEEEDKDDIDLLDDETVYYEFTFVLSLLSLTVQRNPVLSYRGDYPYIFLKQFPNLVHLEMESDYRNLHDRQDFSPIHLPRLRHLEIHEVNGFTEDYTDTIYPLLILPSLTTLSLHRVDSDKPSFDPSLLFPSHPFFESFYRSFPTLTDVYLTCQRLGVPKCFVDRLAPQTSIRFHSSWLPGMAEADSRNLKVVPRLYVLVEMQEGPDGNLIEKKSEPGERNVRKIVNETIYEIAGDLTSWLSSRVEGMKRLGDVDGARELIRILKPAGEWRKWIED